MTAATATASILPTETTSNTTTITNNDTSIIMEETDPIYQDLITFLTSPRTDLRKAATEATLAALSSENNNNNNEAAQRLTSLNAIQPLCKIASIASPEVGSCDALAALSILCSHELVGNQCILDFMEGSKGVGRMLEIALSSPPTPPSTAASVAALSSENKNDKLALEWNEWRRQVNYACALLANVTRTEKGAADFIGLSFPKEAVHSSVTKENNGEEEKESGAGKEEDGTTTTSSSTAKQDTSKPTATLLLSRFLNPAFVDATSPAYKSAMEAWDTAKHNGNGQQSSNLDEYDSDLDDETLEKDEPTMASTDSLKPQQAEPTTHEDEYYDPYQHVAAVVMNITQLETGRDFLMRLIQEKKKETTTSHLQSILPQLNSPNLHRRQGIAGTLKNCCFSKDSIWWLLNVVHMDKSLVMPLAGPEDLTIDEKVGLDPDYWLNGPQNVREPDALVRLYVIEALLLLLASGHYARETLRERRVYIIIKMADMVEESEEVSERLLECVQYLRRDEEGTEEGSSDRRAYEKYAQGMMEDDGVKNENLKALPPSTTVIDTTPDVAEDYDHID